MKVISKVTSKQIASVLLILISILLPGPGRNIYAFAAETAASAQTDAANTEIAPAAEPAETASAAAPAIEYRHSQIRVTKKGSRSDLHTDGAVFTVYTDPECTATITSYTTNLHGQCVIATSDAAIKPYLPSAGKTVTLYLKETKAPSGCAINPSTYPITISAGADTDSDSGKTSGILSYLICIDNKPEITIIDQALEIKEDKPKTPETSETKTTEVPSTQETAQTAQTSSTAETTTAQTASTAKTDSTETTTTQTARTERSSSSANETSSTARSETKSPKTGDSSAFHIASALLSLFAAASALVILLKRKQSDR